MQVINRKKWLTLVLLPLLGGLAACDSVKKWTDKEPDEETRAEIQEQKSRRITVLSARPSVAKDPSVADIKVELPPPLQNVSWPQRGANASNALGAVALSGVSEAASASVGRGSKWTTVLVTAPVVADNTVYAMDARGHVSAHEVANAKQRWVSEAPASKEKEDLVGGGLAVAGEQLFVTTGRGEVLALNTQNGSVIWRRNILVPIRSAPKLQLGVLYVMTAESLSKRHSHAPFWQSVG